MKQRILTAIGFGALYIIFILIGSFPFALFIALIAAIAFMELCAMKKISPSSVPAIIGALFVVMFVLQASLFEFVKYLPLIRLSAIFIIIMLIYMVFSKNRFSFDQAAHIFLAAFYIGFSFYLFVQLRYSGLAEVFFVQILIWCTDSGAYFVGRKLGKRKLSPHISPNKSVEGAIGGVVIAAIAAIIIELIVPGSLFPSWGILLGISVVISVFGQLGDLVESAIKRYYGVKDSGNILPGHGGLLDRFDSLIFILPILFIFNVIG
ncbi:phosphatidate cytidylyltransferase [Scopulibacillus daqui]|uniref:Phosphatidate cytidylyltransferase n=1 Tax=Scopulibacillus daqui TaxID=1469162 RepID=A0ABS2PWE4_9BACL|nr:phosphatidate cytidylyltransferase [Scopulibacillus daqui]MBM7644379.1 phosphatidate cytidylyltransferase [Scopulibacillus daqui]